MSMQALFPIPACYVPTQVTPPRISTWMSHLLYRTSIPNSYVFFAIHLLLRLSRSHHAKQGGPPPLFHHRLLLSALILSTSYLKDNSFSSRSWREASMSFWTIPQIDGMQLELLQALNWRLRLEGEDLGRLLEKYEVEWESIEGRIKTEKEKAVGKVSPSFASFRTMGFERGKGAKREWTIAFLKGCDSDSEESKYGSKSC
ncbi:hypothetical protein BT69DRAFT_1348165 [Atractiella rhizophila]|nr:hypothetical protein BT69DRAFT_1348165 [Atractiella rhizophila]